MISRRSSDITARTDTQGSRVTSRRPTIRRGIKKRGILPSFGDIVLPIVSVAAVGLLVLAGRQFFINGIKTPPGISSTRAYAESPALIAEREKKQEAESSVKVSIAGEKDDDPALDSIVKQEVKPKTDSPAIVASTVPEKPKSSPVNVSQPPAKKPVPASSKPAPKPQPAKPQVQPKPQPAKTQPNSQKKAEPKKPEPKKAESKKPEPKKAELQKKATATASSSSKAQWRVQIGAYTSKSGAEEAAKKLKKAGYNATVYSNPGSKHHKVWVSGGTDKRTAERTINAMKKLGYGSSFAFPPTK